MKKVTIIFAAFLFLFSGSIVLAQSPNEFSYQAVVRGANNQILTNQNVGVLLSILETSASGSIVYSESHTISTNQYGMINISVGSGSVISGVFSNISWGNNIHFLKTDIDITGGSSYQFMGTTQLKSVPYALYANIADSIKGGFMENDPIYSTSVASNISAMDTANWNNKLDAFIELDPLYSISVASSISAMDTLAWSNKLDTEVDGDSTNELQLLTFVDDTLYLSKGNQVFIGDTSSGGQWQQQGNNINFNTGNVAINSTNYTAKLNLDDYDQGDTTVTLQSYSNGGIAVFGKAHSTSDRNWMNVGVQGDVQIDGNNQGRGVAGSVYGNGVFGYGIRGEASLDSGSNVGASGVALSRTGNSTRQVGGEFAAIPDWDPSKGAGTGYNYGVYAEGRGKNANRGILAKAVGTDTNSLSYGALIYANNDVVSTEKAFGVYAWANGSSNENIGVSGSVFSDIGQYNFGGAFSSNGSGNPSLHTENYGIKAVASNNRNTNFGVYGLAEGSGSQNIGIWGKAQGNDAAANNYGGEFYGYSAVQSSNFNVGVTARADSSTHVNRGVEGIASGKGTFNQGGYFTANAPGNGVSGRNAGVEGWASGNKSANFGVLGSAMYTAPADTGAMSTPYLVGVYGQGGGSTGQNHGIVAYSWSDASGMGSVTAVYGEAESYNSSKVFSQGVDGTTNSISKQNIGVGGWANGYVSGDSLNYGIYGYSANADNNYGVFATSTGSVNKTGLVNYGIYAEAANGSVANHAGFFEGDVTVTGNLNVVGSISKGSGTFKIDHPTDPENKFLVHSFVESPEMMNVYSGNITTDANGLATVNLPDYFSSANKDFRYQLTCIGVFAQAIVKDEISSNTFVVQTDKANVKLSWQVTAVRNDKYAQQHRVVAEQEKKANEKGKYLHPELYDRSVDDRIYPRVSNNSANLVKMKKNVKHTRLQNVEKERSTNKNTKEQKSTKEVNNPTK
ncbi:MAG: hypothetical protein DRI86_03990 [Bacteroidetes bacterium]|nr:MAG: hypothetical protein DRI86_03990 [Bacteroidota bacterium]